MKFNTGKFYKHRAGRCIAIVGEVKTYAWGEMLVVEETDKTGHSISCIDKESKDTADSWIEIGYEEWLDNFELDRSV